MSSEVDWTTSRSYLFLNPRLPKKLIQAIEDYKKPNLLAHIWLASSGTTSDGEVKLIGLSKRALLASAAAVNSHLLCTKKDIWLNTLPHYHVGGLGVFCRAHLTKSKVVDVSEREWSAEDFLRYLTEYKITVTSLVPTQVYDVVRTGKRSPERLRAVVVGGSALEPELYLQARRLGYPLLPSFGMTEMGSQIATAEMSTVAEKAPLQYPLLKVLPHCELEIDAAKTLKVRSAALCSYIVRMNAEKILSEQMIGEESWFTTGDRAELSGGYLRPLGRAGDLIKISGELVNVTELRELLVSVMRGMQIENPNAVSTLLVLPDERKSNRVALVLKQDLWNRADEIVARWNSRVLPVAKVKQVYFLKEIPQAALGKIATGQIQKLLRPLQ